MSASSTIALFASGRRQGNTGRLLDAVAGPAGIEVVDLGALDIAPYDYEHSHRHDDFEPLMARVLEHRNLVFATPIYWSAPAAPMKIFLDRVTDLLDIEELRPAGRQLRTMTAFVLCTSVYATAGAPFVEAFRETFAYLGLRDGGVAHLDCRAGYDPVAAGRTAAEFQALLRAATAESAINQ